MCFLKALVWTQYFARTATSGFIKDALELKEHWRKKACLDAKSVKVKVPQLAVWISHKSCRWRHIRSCANFTIPWWHVGESGGCIDATSAHITTAWKSFRQLLPIITNRGISLKNWGNIFSSSISKNLLYGCKTWPASNETIRPLTSADNGMVCWICSDWLGIVSVTEEIRWCSLRYFGYLWRMDKNVWPRRVNDYVVPGILPRGHPQLRWGDVITKELKDLNIRRSGKNLLTNG